MRLFVTLLTSFVLLAILAAGVIFSGLVPVAATDAHGGFIHWVLETTRERSIATASDDIEVPDLNNPRVVQIGANHYASMCAGCHGNPGSTRTELAIGLNPAAPDLTTRRDSSPKRDFWVIKNGLRMTGMPAWGVTHDDQSLWGLTAFVSALPDLSEQQYRAFTSKSASGAHAEHDHDANSDDRGHSADQSQNQPAGPETGEVSHEGDGHDHEAGQGHGNDGGQSGAGMSEADIAIGVMAANAEALGDALASADQRRVRSLLANDVLVFESGSAEHGLAEYAGGHMSADMTFMGQMDRQLLERQVFEGDRFAVVASRSRLAGLYNGSDVDINSNETLVLEQRDDGWKIIHVHWSSSR